MEYISYPVSHNHQAIWPFFPLVIIYRTLQISLSFSCVQMYVCIFWSLYNNILSVPCWSEITRCSSGVIQKMTEEHPLLCLFHLLALENPVKLNGLK